ncbi:MAG: DUF262 domain-containing protein [Myroides sp.]
MFSILKNDELKPLTIQGFYEILKKIDFTPLYQRYGNIWTVGKKQLLIDTIINEFDIPKFYFNYFINENNDLNPNNFIYAIIDGKQRLLAIKEFLDNKLKLSDSITYYKDESLILRGLNRLEIAERFPEISNLIDNYILDVVYIITDEEEKIEELFLRLNGGSALNNAEKRNAIGGYLNRKIREISETHPFFIDNIKFKNPRFQHQDLLTKLAFIEFHNRIQTLSNDSLNQFVRTHNVQTAEIDLFIDNLIEKLNLLNKIFHQNDKLLIGKGIIPVYYWFINENQYYNIDIRDFLEYFEDLRKKNRLKDPEMQNPELVDFDRWNQQGTHRDKSLLGRVKILEKYYMEFVVIN